MRRNLIVSFLSSVPSAVRARLGDATLLLACPVQQWPTADYPGGRKGYRQWLAEHMDGQRNVIRGLYRAAGGAESDEIGHVCVLGFSNGCIGVDETLQMNDAFRLDTVLALDGIHGLYGPGASVRPARYKSFLNFGVHAAAQNPELHPDAPVCVITHSSIGPIMKTEGGKVRPYAPSTTETANVIWSTAATRFPAQYLSADCGYGCLPVMHLERMRSRYAEPVEICAQNGCFQWLGMEDGWYDRRGANNFFVLGWGYPEGGVAKTKDPAGYADHAFQAQVVLPALLQEFVVNRWTRRCFYVAATQGLGQAPPPLRGACKLSQGVVYDQSDAGVRDYFPDLEADAPLPAPTCPTPPAGQVIVGRPGDPCAVVGEAAEPSAPPVGAERAGVSLLSLAAGAAGFAGGYHLLRRTGR